jgi:hypothetical protein
MNVSAALLMIDFVCQNRHSENSNDYTRKELMIAISELATLCLEAILGSDDAIEWSHCTTEIEFVKEIAETASHSEEPEWAYSQIEGVSLRAVPCPEET